MKAILTPDQKNAVDYVISWYKNNNGRYVTTIGGLAGTGKTFLISRIREELRKINPRIRIAFCAYTGKAASVLGNKLEQDGNMVQSWDYVGTIHRLMYRPKMGRDPSTGKKIIIGWVRHTELDYDLIIIDEASMVNSQILYDITSYNIPVLAVGDHGQLPPIENNVVGVLSSPDITLTSIHRTMEIDPIVSLSRRVRNGERILNGVYTDKVFKIRWSDSRCQELFDSIKFDDETIVLCGMNRTRVQINNRIRERLGMTQNFPYPGEKIICLRNNYESLLMNGQGGKLLWLMPKQDDICSVTVKMDYQDSLYSGLMSTKMFGQESYSLLFDEISDRKRIRKKYKSIFEETGYSTIDFFDFGYCISVHRSQGSEWNRVVLFEERSRYWDDYFYIRWMYTAVTRSKEKLFIISN